MYETDAEFRKRLEYVTGRELSRLTGKDLDELAETIRLSRRLATAPQTWIPRV